MASFSWVRWLRPSARTKVNRPRRPDRRLDLELLETRLAPATFTWDGRPDGGGSSADNRWSTPSNWVGDVAPSATNFDDLVFPSGAAQLANQNDFNNATFKQIVVSGGGYTLSGSPITLGNSTAGTGFMIQNAGTATDTVSFDIHMGGSAGNKQFFTVVSGGGVLDVSGVVSGNTGVELSKDGAGILQLDNDNSAFTGPVTVSAGALRVTNSHALGTGPSTTVEANAQLQVSNVAGPISNSLRLNGPGLSNDGALLNVSGANTWAGNVELDSDTTLGANLGTSLTITGVITDLGSGHNLTKEMPGQVILDPLNSSAGNTYRGQTNVNAGTLTIRHSHALGTGDSGTVVNSGALESGTLDLQFVANPARIDPFANAAGDGFSVPDEQLTVNGPGREGLDQIIVTGSTTATGTPTHVDSGALHNQAGNNSWQQNITFWTDSSQIPPPFVTTIPFPPFVNVFAYNHLIIGVEANSILTLNGHIGDNAGGTAYTFDKDRPGTLVLTNSNTYTGATQVLGGVLNIRDSQALGTAASSNVSVFTGGALALEADPIADSVTPSSTDLTVSKNLILVGGGVGGTGALHNLIGRNKWTGTINLLANASIGVEPDPDPRGADSLGSYNDFSQLTASGVISGGGVFTKVGLGELVLTASNTYSNRTQINQGWVTITNSGALGANDNARVSVNHDLTTAATGGSVHDTVVANGAALHLKSAAGNMTIGENIALTGLGITGANTINSDLWGGPSGTGLGALVNLVGNNVINGNVLFAGGPGVGPGIGVETSPAYPAAGGPFSQLTFTGTLEETLPIGTLASGFVKLGTQRLIVQGPGYYTGNVDVKQGVLRIQNSTALGFNGTAAGGASTTTVESGAALELMESVSTENGGLQSGLELGLLKSLILSGLGNNTTPSGPVDTLAVLAPVAPMTADAGGDQMIRGSITLKTDATNPDIHISVPTNARLTLLGNIDDQASTNPAGAGIFFEGGGKLVLGGTNSYRGVTNVTAGVLNVQSSQALGSPAGGTVVANNASIELQGNISVGGEPLTIQGNGGATPENVTPNWMPIGPGPILGGQTPGTMPVTGRLTGVVVDPTDSNVIFVTAAGGGAWRTRNAGLTWTQLTDNVPGASFQDLFTGAIAMAPTNSNVLYVGTGEANNSGDSYYGRGILKSTDDGNTWTLFQGNSGLNEFDGRTVSKIVVDPANANVIYVALAGNAVNGKVGNGGIWRGDTSTNSWVNLTVGKVPTDTATITLSAADDYSDVSVLQDVKRPNNRFIFAAVGTPDGGFSSGAFQNAVYVSIDGGTTWLENAFPLTDTVPTPGGGTTTWPHNGVTKATGQITGTPIFTLPGTVTVYSAAAYPETYALVPTFHNSEFREIQKLTITWDTVNFKWVVGGWAKTTAQPGADLAGTYPFGQGNYDLPLLVDPTNANIVYVAGIGGGFTTGPWMSTDGGTTWTDIGIGTDGNGPHSDYHALALDTTSPHRLYVGNDGGIWRLDTTAPIHWSDLNGNLLQITEFNGLAVHPTDPNVAYGGSQDNGTEKYSGGTAWNWVDAGDGGIVRIDNNNPNVVYHILNGRLYKSTTGGSVGSWVQIPPAPESVGAAGGGLYFPFVIDSINTKRLVVYASVTTTYSSTDVWESTDQGNTWHELDTSTPIQIQSNVTAIGLAGFQGTFVPDAGYSTAVDKGANSYDPDTIYAGTNALNGNDGVYVTKDHGATWLPRATGLPASTAVVDIAVDPNNRDVAYVVLGGFGTTGKVFKTTNAGQSWANVSGSGSTGLPDLPTYKVVIDPRNGDVFVGNDNGVWLLPKGLGSAWQRFGTNLPNVQVKVLELNTNLNMLTAGTYGRGMFQVSLESPPPAGATNGAIRGVSGSSIWAGPITLAGNVTLRTEGASTLTLSGTITGNFDITKVGPGTLILAGSNNPSYGGTTFVSDGVLGVRNPNALGTPSAPTIVHADPVASPGATAAALQLQSDLVGENLILFGNGQPFNGHNTGALRNVSNFNTYSGGTITLGSDSTIGVDSGSQLTVSGVITDGSNSFGLAKELTGKLVLSGANSYDGITQVSQGTLDVQNNLALGSTAGGTLVRNGAQLEIEPDSLGNNITVSGEALQLSGSGINGTGALLNNGGNNTWAGPVTLQSIPALTPNPPATPPTTVSVGAVSNSTLTINGAVGETGGSFGLTKVGFGRVILAQSDTYSGLTTVATGALQIQNAGALGASGTAANGTVVNAGAALELAGTGYTVSNESLTINGEGLANGAGSPPAATGALRNLSGNNTWTGPVILQANPALNDAAVGVDAGARLTVSGVIQDSAPTAPQLNPVPASSLTKLGAGTLLLSGVVNTYAGKTFVNNGDLAIANAGSLGSSGPEVQTVTVLGTSGTFTLTFANATTSALAVTDPNLAADMQVALESLVSIGGVGGTVTVTRGTGLQANVYTVTFGGTLANANLPQMTSTTTPGVTATVSTLRDGPEGTVVKSGASLQLQGGITVSTEALTLNGMGFNNAGALENVSGNNTWANPITLGSSVGIGVDVATDTLTVKQPISDNGSAFGVTEVGTGTLALTGSAPNTFTGMTQVNSGTLSLDKTPTSEVQQLTVLGSAGNYFLSFRGTKSATSIPFNSPAAAVQATLQSLSTVGVGNVTVTQGVGVNANVYTITFTGTLALANQPQIVATADPALPGATPIMYTVIDGNPAPAALSGNLTIGDGQPGNAVATWVLPNELPVGTTVTVNSDGTLNLNGQTQTLASLVVNDGQATTGASGSGVLTLNALTMAGGTVTAATAGGQVVLAGNVTGTSSANGTAQIVGPGALSLNGANRTFTITRGSKAVDLDVKAPITAGSGTPGLTVAGTGVLQIDPSNTSTGFGTATVTGGSLQVDGTIADVSLAGPAGGSATLSGTGTVGNVRAATTGGNVVSPGDGTAAGTLTGTSLALNSGSTFSANLNTAGTSLFVSTGPTQISLGGATLAGTFDSSVTATSGPYTIIQDNGATLDSSKFAQGNSGFVSGRKFAIGYLPAGSPTTVVLTPTQMNDSLTLSSPTPNNQTSTAPPAGAGVFGESITYVATVMPETGATTSIAGDSVDFKIDGNDLGNFPITLSGGVYTATLPFTSDGAPGTRDLRFLTATGSPHTITAQFIGDANYNPSNPADPNSSFVQTVNKDATLGTIAWSASNPSPAFGQTSAIEATISAVAPGSGYPVSPGGPSGASFPDAAVSFTIDGSPAAGTVTYTPAGTATNATLVASLPVSGLSAGPHKVRISYSGDADFTSFVSTTDTILTIGKSPVSVTVQATAPASTPVFGQAVTFQATVASSASGDNSIPADGDTVIFLDNGSNIGSGSLTGGKATLTLSSLSAGSHSIKAQFQGDGNFQTGTATLNNFTVSQATANTTLVSSANPSAVNQPVVFTATVAAQAPGGGVPDGSVTFAVDSVNQVTKTLDATGKAQFSTSTLIVGNHTVTATYAVGGSGNYAVGTQGSVSQQVLDNANVVLSTSVNPAAFGQSVIFSVAVSAATGSGTPGGTVTFVVDGTGTTVGLDPTGHASLPANNSLSVGAHAVSVSYSGQNGAFAPADPATASSKATMSLTETVTQGGTTTTISQSPGATVYGQPVSFVATVAAVAPASGTLTGTVSFIVDGISQATVPVNAAGQAGVTFSTLSAGGHTIFAVYGRDANFSASASPAVGQVVQKAATGITMTSSTNIFAVGQQETFIATVNANSPSTAVPVGTVTFVVDGVAQSPVTLNAAGQAGITLNLPRGSHTITANYSGNGNFAPASTSSFLTPASTTPSQFISVVSTFMGSPNQVWINEVYLDLLNRPVDAAGLTYWSDQIEEFNVSRNDVVLAILASDEYRGNAINKLYSDLLNRTPILPDLQFHINALRAGETYEQLTANFLASSEYYLRDGRMDFGVYTNAVYQYVLHRAPSASDAAFWVNFLQTGSRLDMATMILQSPEYQGNFIRGLYQNLLGRTPDGSPNFWFTAMHTGTRDETVIAGIAASDEYFIRLAPFHNTQAHEQSWISQVYVDLLGRPIDANSLSFWDNAQEHGVSRLFITEQITNSGEYRGRLISSFFVTMLNRQASANEQAVYQNYLLGGGTDEGVKAQIIGSSEYYFGRGSGNNFNFLSAAYKDILHRPLDSAGVSFWGTKLANNGGNRTALALEMLGTFDAEQVLVQNYYQATLRRNADPAGLSYWTGQLASGFKDDYVLGELTATDEYFNKF